jgi:hypothetical protein
MLRTEGPILDPAEHWSDVMTQSVRRQSPSEPLRGWTRGSGVEASTRSMRAEGGQQASDLRRRLGLDGTSSFGDSTGVAPRASATKKTQGATRKSTDRAGVEATIEKAAAKHGVDPLLMKTFAQIESSMKPSQRTGSYKGLFQLSDSEFKKYGGGNIYNANDNANAAAAKFKAEIDQFKSKYGRTPDATDLYMIHQQGQAGFAAHMKNPDGLAWKNVRSYYKSDKVAKKAIWGNVPSRVKGTQQPFHKGMFGSVEKMTSRDFVEGWRKRINQIQQSFTQKG